MAKWINDELERRGWSQRELGRRADISNTTISKVASGEIDATWDFCAAVGRAFGERPEVVFRLAGLLPPPHGQMDDLSQDEAEIVQAYRALPVSHRQTAIDIVRGLADRLERRRKDR